jgi:L-fuculose-phosphate aldolase
VPEVGGVIFSSVFLDKNSPVDERIDEMIQWGKRFCQLGTVQGAEGNLSFRTRLGFIITGSGIALDSLTKDKVVEIRGVVFGLNKPSVYIKGQVVPSMETLLHSGIYEVLPEINVIFHTHDHELLKVAEQIDIPSTVVEQPAGSRELAQETVNMVNQNKNIKYFVLKNHGVIALGATMSETGKLMEEMHNKADISVKPKTRKKKLAR